MKIFPNIEQLLDLYHDGLYLDAYQATETFWQQPEIIDQLDAEQCVQAARLAVRVGGNRLFRYLLYSAWRKDSENPTVRYYLQNCEPGKYHLYKDIKRFEEASELNSGDKDLDSSWLADYSLRWAMLRDYDKAEKLLAKAREINDSRWVQLCGARFLIEKEERKEAAKQLEALLEQCPQMPALVATYCENMSALGRSEEALERLLPIVENGQSYENLNQVINLYYTLAEQPDPIIRKKFATKGFEASMQLEKLMPLKDKETDQGIKERLMEGAMLLGDKKLMIQFSSDLKCPFYRNVAKNLEKNRDDKLDILPYKFVRQKGLTCYPSSAAAVAGAFEIDLDEESMAKAVTYDGTPTHRMVEWLENNGFSSKVFRVTPETSRLLISNGIPFVFCAMGYSSGHAMAAIGMDFAGGTMLVHDPSSTRWSRVLIDRFNEREGPFGLEGLVFVPKARAAELDILPIEESEPLTALVDYRSERSQKGLKAGEKIVENMAMNYPDHAVTQLLQARSLADQGQLPEAIDRLESLLAEYPESLLLHHTLLGFLHRTADTARIIQVLGEIVEGGRIPGISREQKWRCPPAELISRYADFHGMHADGYKRAENLLIKGVRREWSHAQSYHVLGDVYSRQLRYEECELPYRIAALLSSTDDHYARAYSNLLRRLGKEEQAITHMRDRVVEHGKLIEGAQVWIALVDLLEDYGKPQEAIDALQNALKAFPNDSDLLCFAVRFYSRCGDGDNANTWLSNLKALNEKLNYRQAAVFYYQWKGEWNNALELCEEWLKENHDSPEVCRLYISLYLNKNGQVKTLKLVEEWYNSSPDNENFEEIYIDELKSAFEYSKVESILRKRIARSPYDIWAQRELGYRLLRNLNVSEEKKKTSFQLEIKQLAENCLKLSPNDAFSLFFEANYYEAIGQPEKFVNLCLKAVALSPEFDYGYEAVWRVYDKVNASLQNRIISELETNLLRATGQLFNARGLAFRIAEYCGLQSAYDAVQRWKTQFPNDPAVAEAEVDLLLNHGQGVEDGKKAVALLEGILKRFPHNLSLRMSLSHALHVVEDAEKCAESLTEVLQRQPVHSGASRQLSVTLLHLGKGEEALKVQNDAITKSPKESSPRLDLCQLLFDMEEPEKALNSLKNALKEMPENIELRERAITISLDLGEDNQAVEFARDGIVHYPDGAALHFMLANALYKSRFHNDLTEVEETLQNALQCNARLYDAAEMLSQIYTDREQFDKARAVMQEVLDQGSEPQPIYAQFACITRKEGNLKKAIKEVAEVTEKWPHYEWAWSALIAWIKEADAKKVPILAKRHLEKVPAHIEENCAINSRRLSLLESCDVDGIDYEKEWDKLLGNFPREEDLYTVRFDILADRNCYTEALALMNRADKYHSHSGYILSRKVQALALLKRGKEAIETAEQLWQINSESGSWVQENACEWLEKTSLESRAAIAMLKLIEEKKFVHADSFSLLVKQFAQIQLKQGFWGKITDLVSSVAKCKRLQYLMDILDQCPWEEGFHRAAVLDVMYDNHCPKVALEYWEKNKELCRSQTPVWASIGQVLLRIDNHQKEIVSWLADWRSHPGAPMWAVSSYLIALHLDEENPVVQKEMYHSAIDGLRQLSYDWTVQYFVVTACEAAIRLKKTDALMELFEQYGDLLRESTEDFYCPNDVAESIRQCLLIIKADLQENSVNAKKTKATLKEMQTKTGGRWLLNAWESLEMKGSL